MSDGVPTYKQYERRTSAIRAQADATRKQTELLGSVLGRLDALEDRIAGTIDNEPSSAPSVDADQP